MTEKAATRMVGATATTENSATRRPCRAESCDCRSHTRSARSDLSARKCSWGHLPLAVPVTVYAEVLLDPGEQRLGLRIWPHLVKARVVLDQLRPHLQRHHHLKIPTEVLKAAIALSEQYLPNRQLPDKAIDVLDQACSRCRLKLVLQRSDPKMLKDTVVPSTSVTSAEAEAAVVALGRWIE